MISREEVREALTGPIASLKTPFTRDGEIDYPGLRRLIDGNLDSGSNSSLLTYGDSLFTLMTDDEIADVARAVAEHAGKRGLTVAADGGWWTGKTVEFARYCREVGVDVLMVKPPVWGASGTVRDFGGALRRRSGRDPGDARDQHLGRRHRQGPEDDRGPA